MIKYVIGIYLLIGILIAPFMRSNDLVAYRGFDKSNSIGRTLASVPFWPSYLFSIEPELNASNSDSFITSITDVLKFREDKLFTGGGKSKHYQNFSLVYEALGACVAAEGASINMSDTAIVKAFFDKGANDFDLLEVRGKVMKRFDGHDFSDIYHEGEKCRDLYNQKNTAKKLSAPVKLEYAVVPVAPVQEASSIAQKELNNFNVGYGLKWGEVSQRPQFFIQQCQKYSVENAMLQGGWTEERAREWVGDSCENEFAKLKKCLSGEAPYAAKCLPEVDG